AIEEGWRLEGTTSDGTLLMFKEGALVAQQVATPSSLERVAAADKRSLTPARELDSRQTALRDGAMGLEFKLPGSTSGHDTMVGRIELADGSRQEVIFGYQSGAPRPGRPNTSERLRKDSIGYHLNQMLEFDNGYPVTVGRVHVVDGRVQHGWVQ